MNTYDVIVVGAGNGGLASAALIAKAGYKTLVLEKHNLPGGCATSFVRGRFEFEAALHELCHKGTDENAISASNIFKELGADMDLAYEDMLFRAVVPGENGYDVTVPTGYDAFLDAMEAAVPGCRDSVKKLLDLIKPIDEAQAYMETVTVPAKLFKLYPDFVRSASHSAEEVMNDLGIPEKAQQILCTYWGYLGVPTDDLNAVHYISLLAAFATIPPSMPHHRSHYLSLSLVNALQRYGGEIRYNTEVTKFLYDGSGACIGVVAGGEVIYAKKIVSNIIPNNVWNRSDPKFVSSASRKLANARKLGMTFITIYLGLDASMEELGIKDYSVFIMTDPDPRKQFEHKDGVRTFVVNCLNKVLPESSPEGTCTLFFTIMYMPGEMDETLRAQDYKKYKNEIAEEYIRRYEETIGVSVRDHIEEIVVATPVTFARYLGTPDGAIYGYANEAWDNVVTRTVTKDMDFKVPNLYFCGGHYIRGDGYPSAYITGAMTARDVIKDLKEGK